MPMLTFKNHFRFGYSEEAFLPRKNSEDKWWATYGRCERMPLNFHDECLNTAKLIRQQTSEPITVLFSGGVDSEVVLRSFVESGIRIKVAIMRFKNDLNVHDISWAVIVCESLSVPYEFYELDLLQFWQSQAWEYATPTYCASPQLLSTMWLVDQISGYTILGSAECLLVKVVPESYVPSISPYERSDWHLWEKEKIAAWYRHFIVRNRNGCPGFFQFTPEIMLSYLFDPVVDNLVNDRCIGKLSTESSKLAMYQQHFPIISRPKYTGFEKVQSFDVALRAQLREKFSFADQVVKTKYEDLVLSLLPNS